MTYTCTYGTSWLGNNFLVILLSIAVLSFVYLASRFLPGSTRMKLTGVIRMELTQVFISMIIILALLGTTSFICSAAASVTSFIGSPSPVSQNSVACSAFVGSSVCIPFPALPEANVAVTAATQPGDPFAYALAYTGNYAFDTGPRLGIEIYAFSYSYAIVAVIWSQISDAIGKLWPTFSPSFNAGPVQVSLALPVGTDLSTPYSILSGLFMDILSPMVMLGVGIMLIQYLILVISQASAFAIILPIALIMRLLPFGGANMRYAANSMIAIAIALYIVYPVMVVFDSYFIHWLFTPCAIGATNTAACNPEAGYLLITYSHDNLNSLFSSTSCSFTFNLPFIPFSLPICPSDFFGFMMQLDNAVSSLPGAIPFVGIVNASGDQIIQGVQYIALSISEFMFIVVVLFAVNMTVALGFAVGLAKALESGVEGAASFWSSI
jgi:hypothetical protein